MGVLCQKGDIMSIRKQSNCLVANIDIDRGSNFTYNEFGYPFGKVTKGMSVVDSITGEDLIRNSGLILSL